jgi:hypothetical protein
VKYNVLPIDDRRFERFNPTIAGRPQLITGTTQVLFAGMKRLSENSVIDVKNRSFTVTAAIDTPADGPTNGVLIAQGGRFGGWALFVKNSRAKFVYNVLGLQEFLIGATEELTPGSQGNGVRGACRAASDHWGFSRRSCAWWATRCSVRRRCWSSARIRRWAR